MEYYNNKKTSSFINTYVILKKIFLIIIDKTLLLFTAKLRKIIK